MGGDAGGDAARREVAPEQGAGSHDGACADHDSADDTGIGVDGDPILKLGVSGMPVGAQGHPLVKRDAAAHPAARADDHTQRMGQEKPARDLRTGRDLAIAGSNLPSREQDLKEGQPQEPAPCEVPVKTVGKDDLERQVEKNRLEGGNASRNPMATEVGAQVLES